MRAGVVGTCLGKQEGGSDEQRGHGEDDEGVSYDGLSLPLSEEPCTTAGLPRSAFGDKE